MGRANAMRRALAAMAYGAALALLSAQQGQPAQVPSGSTQALPAAAPASTAPAPPASSDDALFGSETVQAASNDMAAPQDEFLKYDQVRVGGSIKGSFGWNPTWSQAWEGPGLLSKPSSMDITPDLEARLTIAAKPLSDLAVNSEFRTSWPFGSVRKDSGGDSYTVPNITLWSFYSKFNWQEKAYFSFGKQALSWGVSRGAFQPADDIFAASRAIDLTDTGAEREGPVSLKMTIPIGITNNFYLFGAIPSDAGGSSSIRPSQARLATKAEFGFGNTELAAAAYYSQADHARLLVMGTTGTGDFNFSFEAVLKAGTERVFLEEQGPMVVAGADRSDRLFFTGSGGLTYSNADSHLVMLAQYLYNGEGQKDVTALEALLSGRDPAAAQIRSGTHYAFLSLSRGEFLQKDLTATVYAIANLSDGSGLVAPSIAWQLFSYMSASIGATFSFGPAGSEYVLFGPGLNSPMSGDASLLPQALAASRSAVSLNFLLTMTTQGF